MKFVIRPEAREDILRQYQYYRDDKDSRITADRFVDAVESSITQVSSNPQAGTPKPLTNQRLLGLRSWPVQGFPRMRIYYIATDRLMRVIRVLHGKRDLDPILKDSTEN